MAAATLANGRVIHYDDSGTGAADQEGQTPLVLLCGLGAPRSFWSETVTLLHEQRPHLRIITIDNRDAGENEPEQAAYTIEVMADDVVGLLTHLGIEQVDLGGLSMGGFISQHLVLNHPGMVRRLLLFATPPVAGTAAGNTMVPPTEAEWVPDAYERQLKRAPNSTGPGFGDANPDRINAIAEAYRGNGLTLPGYARQMDAINTSHNVRARLGEIQVPTLIIHGDSDPVVPHNAAKLLERDIANATLHSYPGGGHLINWEAPQAFVQDVLEFLDATDTDMDTDA